MDAAQAVLAEFVWLGSAGTLRSKTLVLQTAPSSAEELSAQVVPLDENECHGSVTDIVLKPRKLFRDPFRGGQHLLVLCDAFLPPQVDCCGASTPSTPLAPHPANMRAPCEDVLAKAQPQAPVFAVEQEYFVPPMPESPQWCDAVVQDEPAGTWPHAHLPDPTKPQLYGPKGELAALMIPAAPREAALARAAAARRLSEQHLHMCLHAGLKLTSCAEGEQPGLWSYKLGPLPGTELGDQLWVSRHLLIRLSEAMGIPVLFDERSLGRRSLGCHFKFSTTSSREPGMGVSVIQQYLGRLQATHVQHMQTCGRARTPDLNQHYSVVPTCSVGGAMAALVIPITTALRGCGHITDRRAPANADPWAVVMHITAAALDLPCAAPTKAPAACHTEFLSMAAAAHVAAAAAAFCPGSSSGNSQLSWAGQPSGECSPSASLATEDVLVQELDRMDGEDLYDLDDDLCSEEDDSASTCSDGTSPQTGDATCDDAMSAQRSTAAGASPATSSPLMVSAQAAQPTDALAAFHAWMATLHAAGSPLGTSPGSSVSCGAAGVLAARCSVVGTGVGATVPGVPHVA